ncbi:MAG: class I SAM-dependent methyltransferase [Pyrinomonadaceae bacterium]
MTQVALPENQYNLWHDRAVFHFLTNLIDRDLYLANLRRALKPGGHLIIATFSDDGPMKCSGLEVERYSIGKLTETLGPDFNLDCSFREAHETPFHTVQNFLYAHFRMA